MQCGATASHLRIDRVFCNTAQCKLLHKGFLLTRANPEDVCKKEGAVPGVCSCKVVLVLPHSLPRSCANLNSHKESVVLAAVLASPALEVVSHLPSKQKRPHLGVQAMLS